MDTVLSQDFLGQLEQIFNQAEISNDQKTLTNLYNIIDVFCKFDKVIKTFSPPFKINSEGWIGTNF